MPVRDDDVERVVHLSPEEDACALDGVLLDQGTLFGCQRSRLVGDI